MSKPIRQRVTVSTLIQREGQILLLERAAHEVFLPGYYDLPGGKVDFGEPPDVAARREAHEEAGVTPTLLGIYNVWTWVSEYRGEPTQFIAISYAASIAADAQIKIHGDFASYRWVTAADLPSVNVTADLRTDLERGFAWLRAAPGQETSR